MTIMNIVRTVILKLLVNPETPDVLRGELQLVPENGDYAFRDEEDLLALLHQIISVNLLHPNDTIDQHASSQQQSKIEPLNPG